MTRQEFEIKLRGYRKALRLLLALWLLAPFLIWTVFRLLSPFLSEPMTGWVVVLLVGFWAVLPVFVLSQLARRLGLFCPRCGVRDDAGRFIRRVQRDGRCPRCKQEVLNVG
jgi:hypothetical protein